MPAADWDNPEASELASTILKNVNQAAQLSSPNTVAMLHREARSSPHPNRLASLGSLVAALHARSCRTDGITDLDEATSSHVHYFMEQLAFVRNQT